MYNNPILEAFLTKFKAHNSQISASILLLFSCCENNYTTYLAIVIFTTGKQQKLSRLLCALNLVKLACNIGLLYINGKLFPWAFRICHQNPDSGLSGSRNPVYPVSCCVFKKGSNVLGKQGYYTSTESFFQGRSEFVIKIRIRGHPDP